MKARIKDILIIVLISTLVSSGLMYLNREIGIGAITNIAGSDKLTDSRTTINNNFIDLDITKMEMSTTSIAGLISATSLVTIGTITTGVWTGTPITETNGGTGQTTYSTGDVLYSDSANSLAKLAVGSNGEVLALAAGVPAWTENKTDLTLNYAWTGTHSFAASTTFSGSPISLNASQIDFRGVKTVFPTTQGASSTAWLNDGNGNLIWDNPTDWQFLGKSELAVANATTTITVDARRHLRIILFIQDEDQSGTPLRLIFNDEDAFNDYAWRSSTNGAADATGVSGNDSRFILIGSTVGEGASAWVDVTNYADTAKNIQYEFIAARTAGSAPERGEGVAVYYETTDPITKISFYMIGTSKMTAGSSIYVYGSRE